MSHHQTTLLLNAPVQRVWAAYTDANQVSLWLPGAGGGICASRPLSREGAFYALRFSRWHRSSIQVVGVEPHKLHQRRFRDIAGHLRGAVTAQFETLGDSTRLVFDLDYTFAPLWLDRLLDRLFGGDIRRQAERELESFQHYIEQAAQPASERKPVLRKTVTLTITAAPAC